jgi:hemerythrin
MPIIEWDESMSVGVREIDAQHRDFVEMINEVFDAYQAGGDDKILERIMRRFCNYTLGHFALEERLMDRYEYTDYSRHVSEHMECSMKALNFFTDYIQGNKALIEELLNYMVAWFRSHTTGTDRALGAYLQSRGFH